MGKALLIVIGVVLLVYAIFDLLATPKEQVRALPKTVWFVLLDASYYDRVLHGPALFRQLSTWIAWSLPMTFLIALAVCWRYVRRVD